MLFWATSKKHKKSACCHTDNDSDGVHVVTIFLVAYTCHSKVYFGIGQENNTVHKNHRRCKTSQCNSCNVLYDLLIWMNVWMKWLLKSFSLVTFDDIMPFWHGIKYSRLWTDWLLPLPSQKIVSVNSEVNAGKVPFFKQRTYLKRRRCILKIFNQPSLLAHEIESITLYRLTEPWNTPNLRILGVVFGSLSSGFETGWDLGLGTLYCSACTWTNVFSSNRIQRNNKGLKITAHMCNWGILWTIRYKMAKTQLPLLSNREQKQGPACEPCTQHHQGSGQAT